VTTNENLKLPIKYTHPLFSRYFTLFLGLMVIVYMFFVIFTKTNLDTPTFRKVLPFIIILFAFDSVSRNLFTLNQVTIAEKSIQFSFLLKKKMIIKWEDIVKIEAHVGKKKYFTLYYSQVLKEDQIEVSQQSINTINSNLKKFFFLMAFTNIIEILNHIKTFAPQIETDEFVSSLLITPNSSLKDKSSQREGKGENNA